MQFYRIKQFYWAVKSLVAKDDLEILNRYLNKSELNLFMKTSKSERQHSVRVCMYAIKYIKLKGIVNIDMDEMCKCALLHDIGKSQVKLNIFSKSFIVIMNSITCDKFMKYNKNKKIINYYNHPQIGVELLKSINEVDLNVINCVRYHHNKENIEKDIYLEILVMCDNFN
jgi:putative nucleotidyltransferase with HDIG domain